MATERQIAANRRNAAHSTGPKTEDGKARSRENALKHGMAGASAGVEVGLSPEFLDRRAKWAAEYKPVGDLANFALDRVVAASFRIERCERTMDGLITVGQQRAELAWDEDRAVEAATVAARLAKDPLRASRQLETSLAGVVLLIQAWLGLLAILETGDWSESEASKALDLLGVAPDFRAGRTLVDAPEGTDPVAFRRTLANEEIDRLEALRDDCMIPLDEMERMQAMAGFGALLSQPAKLVRRYERDAWKRYWDSMKELKAPTQPAVVAPSQPIVVAPTPPVVAPPPIPRPAPPKPAPATVTPAPLKPADRPRSVDPIERRARIEALRSQVAGQPALPGSYVPIAVGMVAAGG